MEVLDLTVTTIRELLRCNLTISLCVRFLLVEVGKSIFFYNSMRAPGRRILKTSSKFALNRRVVLVEAKRCRHRITLCEPVLCVCVQGLAACWDGTRKAILQGKTPSTCPLLKNSSSDE